MATADFSQLAEAHTRLQRDIAALEGTDPAVHLANEARALAGGLLAAGADGLLVARTLSALNDALTAQVIACVARQHRLPAADWCWVAFGSEGRHEQTFVSDQDNGLVFLAADAREAVALRPHFLDFAGDVNARLAECGFSLCAGDIMAGNPRWCLSLAEWRDQFFAWVRCPHPEALLNATIFFDLRALYGDPELVARMQTAIAQLTTDASAFLHLMAVNAVSVPVPLSFRGEVQLENGKPLAALDLKKFGTRLFVDGARIFALAHGVAAAETQTRLETAGALAGLSADEVAAMVSAFSHLIRLRLLQQSEPANRPGEAGGAFQPWHEVDRAVLRESLRQARRLQQRLKLNYGL